MTIQAYTSGGEMKPDLRDWRAPLLKPRRVSNRSGHTKCYDASAGATNVLSKPAFPTSVVNTSAGNQTQNKCSGCHAVGPPRHVAFVTQVG